MEAKYKVVLPGQRPVFRHRLLVLGSTVLWVIVLALVVASSVSRLAVPQWGNPSGEGRSAEIAGSTQVGQRFTAPFAGLHRIDVTLDPATVNTAQQVVFYLKTDPSAAEALWTEDFKASDVSQGEPYRFEFPAIQSSKGQTYYFYLESPDSVPGDAIAAGYSPSATLDSASAYLNGRPVAGDLQFQTFYTFRIWDKFDLLLTRLAEGKPYLFGTKGFYVALAVVYIVLLGIMLWRIARAVLEEERE